MTLQPGTRLGPYEIIAPLGAGGMGEVYRARDTRLGRSVAIKVLPADFSGDARLRIRLEREAKAISSLNHPHICTLHDLGTQDGIDYLVLEHCEGQTLARRLARGPLPLDEVIRESMQIADALDKAHRKGSCRSRPRDSRPAEIAADSIRGAVWVRRFALASWNWLAAGRWSADAGRPAAATAALRIAAERHREPDRRLLGHPVSGRPLDGLRMGSGSPYSREPQ